MLDALKRWIAGDAQGADWRAMTAWAVQRGAQFKRSRDGAGFVVEGRFDARPWRLEWGPPQRSYIAGRELRLRMELGLPQDLNMLVLSRPLMEVLERSAFEQYTAQMQTRIDDTTPEEMRWLAMFSKLPLVFEKELRQHFGAVALSAKAADVWLRGPLAEKLTAASRGVLAGDPPFVLMTLRGRLYLRLQLTKPDAQAIDAMAALFETAATQAVLAAGGVSERPETGPSTATTAWQTQFSSQDIER
ncbi:MAG: hypothetical protein ABI633_05325 [Burkholderiales bacterium]